LLWRLAAYRYLPRHVQVRFDRELIDFALKGEKIVQRPRFLIARWVREDQVKINAGVPVRRVFNSTIRVNDPHAPNLFLSEAPADFGGRFA
jgi:hypothetical protein